MTQYLLHRLSHSVGAGVAERRASDVVSLAASDYCHWGKRALLALARKSEVPAVHENPGPHAPDCRPDGLEAVGSAGLEMNGSAAAVSTGCQADTVGCWLTGSRKIHKGPRAADSLGGAGEHPSAKPGQRSHGSNEGASDGQVAPGCICRWLTIGCERKSEKYIFACFQIIWS